MTQAISGYPVGRCVGSPGEWAGFWTGRRQRQQYIKRRHGLQRSSNRQRLSRLPACSLLLSLAVLDSYPSSC